VAAIVLAAGASTRFGQCKQLLDWKGKTMLAHVTDLALRASLDPVIVVLGCRVEETYPALGDRPVQKLINWRWEEGMSTSVQTGLVAVPPQAEGALFLQCDQPRTAPELLRALVRRFEETEATIVHPVHDSRRGTPVLFSRRFFPELSSVTGDEGGRGLIERYPEEVAAVPVDSPDVLADVDTPADYERLRALSNESQEPSSASTLRPIRHVVIDMDGVLWRGDEPQPGLERLFAFLRQHGIAFTLATNNASRTPEQYAAKLAGFGVAVPLESILTSSLVAASYLAEIAPPESRVHVIGEDGLQQALRQQGFEVVENGDREHLEDRNHPWADHVVVGWDRELTWQKLAIASLLIHRGAAFIGTNPDVSFPTEWGPAPGNGAILAALEAATGVSPVVTGKPEPRMYEEGLRRMGATPETTAMIGDRIDTDIAGAAGVGLTTVLTLSGITTEEDLRASSVRPDLVCEDITDLTRRWEDVLAER
jgi:4-nitrophenyl phosphatase